MLYLDYAWRIIIGLGCVPAIATIYLRCAAWPAQRHNFRVARYRHIMHLDHRAGWAGLLRSAHGHEETRHGGA